MTWHIRNIRDAQWFDAGHFGVFADFELGERFPEVGFNVGTVWPGQPLALYHREANQEGFLVVSGECLLIVEGEEHPLRQWDYFHCPAGVSHIVVGAGDGPAFLIAVGGRVGRGETVYPVEPAALAHEAGLEEESRDPKDAYAACPKFVPIPFRDEFLPG